MNLFLIRKLAAALVLPPSGPLILAILGALLRRSYRRLSRIMLWTGLLSLLAFSLGPVSYLLLRTATDTPPARIEDVKTTQAIVILGCGVRRDAPEYGGDTLSYLSLERVRYGAVLARATGLPILVSGGTVFGDTATESSLMRAALEGEFGVKVRWEEGESRNTRENAMFSAEILQADKIKRITLVMHGFDSRRASEEFTAAGLEVVPAPTGIPTFSVTSALDFVPNASALLGSYHALYELLAIAARDVLPPNPSLR